MYEVVFRQEVVLEGEQRLLNKEQQRELIRLLEADPGSGKPLQRELRGCFRWRHSDRRVVYKIVETRHVVTIIAIGMRREAEVYAIAAGRM